MLVTLYAGVTCCNCRTVLKNGTERGSNGIPAGDVDVGIGGDAAAGRGFGGQGGAAGLRRAADRAERGAGLRRATVGAGAAGIRRCKPRSWRGGRAPASGGQGRGGRDLAARAAVGAWQGGRAPASHGRGRGDRNPTAQAALAAGRGGVRRDGVESGGVGRGKPRSGSCVREETMRERDTRSGERCVRGLSIYDSFAESVQDVTLGKPFFILKSV